jgi:hypothetical protein
VILASGVTGSQKVRNRDNFLPTVSIPHDQIEISSNDWQWDFLSIARSSGAIASIKKFYKETH